MTDAPPLSCQELTEAATEYLEGALSAEQCATFETHLEECDGCNDHLQQLRTTIRLVRALYGNDVAPATRQALLNAFQNSHTT